jgi:tartrate dehydrogenase/decarboxylase / D-malate dehydrogenase
MSEPIAKGQEKMAERIYKIAAIGGDGIGPEVIEAGCRVLDVLASEDRGFAFSFTSFDWGSNYYRSHGLMMPADGLQQLEPFVFRLRRRFEVAR